MMSLESFEFSTTWIIYCSSTSLPHSTCHCAQAHTRDDNHSRSFTYHLHYCSFAFNWTHDACFKSLFLAPQVSESHQQQAEKLALSLSCHLTLEFGFSIISSVFFCLVLPGHGEAVSWVIQWNNQNCVFCISSICDLTRVSSDWYLVSIPWVVIL